MAAPVPLGLWAERFGERHCYVGTSAIAALASLVLAFAPDSVSFALAWGALNAPPSIRGVRAVLFAKHVKPKDLNRAGQMASSFGLLGGVAGPIFATLFGHLLGDLGSFPLCAFIATVAHALSAIALQVLLPAPLGQTDREKREQNECDEGVCDQCAKALTVEESRYQTSLCDKCYDSFYEGYSFKSYSWRLLVSFCFVSGLLELSMNAGVMATFQPIAVDDLGWNSSNIAMINTVSAGLSVVVSFVAGRCRCDERKQVGLAAGLYVFGVLFFTMPPVANWNLIIGLILGLKAQILFMAPFTSIFSRLIGRTRVTNKLTIALCLAPGVGGAVGTIFSPFVMRAANTPLCMLSAIPAVLAWAMMMAKIRRDGKRMDEI
jgi:MFS family permease